MTKGDSPNARRPNADRIALIAGPTASGKSDVALRLALALQQRGQRAVIINADSAQVYRDLKVLSARPEESEMRGVPHRLYGAWDGAQACSAADWAKAAKREIATAHSEGALPILCGGTGLYLKVLIEGIAPIPNIDPQVREKVRALPIERAWRHLQEEDPQAAARLEPSDRQRIARALEVLWSSGRSLSDWQARKSGGIGATHEVHGAVLLPERAWLYERCDARFKAMVERGAIEEVEALLARRLDPDQPVMRAIGVREIAAFLRGESDREQMIASATQATRNYAKRQYTWFRGQAPREWRRRESQNYVIEDIFASLLLN